MADQALFSTVRAAIAFAYSIEHFPVASHPKLGPSTGGNGRLSSMSAYEKHAQGAQIRKLIEQHLSGDDLAVTLALHGTGEHRRKALSAMCREAGKCVRKRGLGADLARRFFYQNGQRQTIAELAEYYELSQRHVEKLSALVCARLDELQQQAEQRLGELFVERGIADRV